jgi:hypothetical protein
MRSRYSLIRCAKDAIGVEVRVCHCVRFHIDSKKLNLYSQHVGLISRKSCRFYCRQPPESKSW